MKSVPLTAALLVPTIAWAQPVTLGQSGGTLTVNGAAVVTNSALSSEAMRAETAEALAAQKSANLSDLGSAAAAPSP